MTTYTLTYAKPFADLPGEVRLRRRDGYETSFAADFWPDLAYTLIDREDFEELAQQIAAVAIDHGERHR